MGGGERVRKREEKKMSVSLDPERWNDGGGGAKKKKNPQKKKKKKKNKKKKRRTL